MEAVDDKVDPSDLYDLVYLVGTGHFGHVWKGVSRTAVMKPGTQTPALEAGHTVALKIAVRWFMVYVFRC